MDEESKAPKEEVLKTTQKEESKEETKKENQKKELKESPKENHQKAPTKNPEPREIDPVAQSKSATIIAIIGLIAGLSGLYMGIYNYNMGGNYTNISLGTDGNSANFTEGSIADVANRVSESVVSITTETRTQSWFGQSSTSSAAGTGFILTKDGYILTNKHVVEGANTVNVTLFDGTTYKKVEVVGTDPLNDSAILKVKDVDNLKPVTLGDSKTITVGQQVVVIGNALGEYQNSVTAGVVSGTGRDLVAGDSSGNNYERLSDMIQTDAAINGGNSGGPIVNAAGEVIGMATAYASSSQTIGFAIPIASVKGIIKNVINNGKYARAVLGVNYIAINASIAEENKLSVKSGAYIYSESGSPIIPGGAAEKAGLANGDIITEVNGIKIGKAGSLSTLIGEYAVGEEVTITVIRNGEQKKVNVILQAYED